MAVIKITAIIYYFYGGSLKNHRKSSKSSGLLKFDGKYTILSFNFYGSYKNNRRNMFV